MMMGESNGYQAPQTSVTSVQLFIPGMVQFNGLSVHSIAIGVSELSNDTDNQEENCDDPSGNHPKLPFNGD